jgi:hypothetical protein
MEKFHDLLPIANRISAVCIADDIIGMRPDETLKDATNRFKLERRVKKIKKIQSKTIKED